MKPQAPCKGCEKRQPSCHSYCEDYISFRKEMDNYNRKVAEERRLNMALDDIWKRRLASVRKEKR